jgi:hypothetical protein
VSPAAAAFKLPESKCTVRERRIIAVSIWTIWIFSAIPGWPTRSAQARLDRGLLGQLYRRWNSLNLFGRLCGLVGAKRICAFSMRAS